MSAPGPFDNHETRIPRQRDTAWPEQPCKECTFEPCTVPERRWVPIQKCVKHGGKPVPTEREQELMKLLGELQKRYCAFICKPPKHSRRCRQTTNVLLAFAEWADDRDDALYGVGHIEPGRVD